MMDRRKSGNLIKVRLTGAQRKRYKYLIKNGKRATVAKKLCLQPIAYFLRSKKPISKIRKTGRKTKRKSRIIKSIEGKYNVAIVDKCPLNIEKQKILQAAILAEIEVLPINGLKPKFLNCSFKPDWIKITCEDIKSRNWLAKVIKKIKPWRGALLQIREGKNIPKLRKVSVWIPFVANYSSEKILNLLQKQNNDLKTDNWIILNEKLDHKGQTLTISIDEASYHALKTVKFKLFFAFTMIQFKMLQKERLLENNADSQNVNLNFDLPSSSNSTVQRYFFNDGNQGRWITYGNQDNLTFNREIFKTPLSIASDSMHQLYKPSIRVREQDYKDWREIDDGFETNQALESDFYWMKSRNSPWGRGTTNNSESFDLNSSISEIRFKRSDSEVLEDCRNNIRNRERQDFQDFRTDINDFHDGNSRQICSSNFLQRSNSGNNFWIEELVRQYLANLTRYPVNESCSMVQRPPSTTCLQRNTEPQWNEFDDSRRWRSVFDQPESTHGRESDSFDSPYKNATWSRFNAK